MGANDTDIIDVLPTLANKAMKVKLSRGTGYARIRDKSAEALIKTAMGDEGQTVTKAVFQDKTCPIYVRAQLASEMYLYHIKYTLPHTDDGWRVLPNQLYMEYSAKMAEFANKLATLERRIIDNYDALVASDMAKRNAHLSEQGKAAIAAVSDYPKKEHMARLLYVNYYFEPISTAGDFRYGVTDADKLRLNELLQTIESNAKADLYRQMLEPMQAFVNKLTVYKGDKGQRLHDSVVTNINDMLHHLPRLSLEDDPVLKAMLAEVKELVTPYVFCPDTLKEDTTARESAKEKMAAIMAKYKEYAL